MTDVTSERYPCELEVPAAGPVLAYLDSLGPVGPEARARIQAVLDAHGSFHIRKHTVLLLAAR